MSLAAFSAQRGAASTQAHGSNRAAPHAPAQQLRSKLSLLRFLNLSSELELSQWCRHKETRHDGVMDRKRKSWTRAQQNSKRLETAPKHSARVVRAPGRPEPAVCFPGGSARTARVRRAPRLPHTASRGGLRPLAGSPVQLGT